MNRMWPREVIAESDDEQTPPLLILARDGLEQIVVNIALDESA
jgi:hypothetical protein